MAIVPHIHMECVKCKRQISKQKHHMCNTCYEYARRHKLITVREKCTVAHLNDIQHQHLTGSMLGDGSIEIGKESKNARLIIGRQSKDFEYVNWQAEIFDNICEKDPVKSISYLDKRTDKIYSKTYFKSRACPAISPYRDVWYPDSIKSIPTNINLTPLVLLIWFLDDGSVHYDNSRNCSTIRLDLNTQGFSENENIFLSKKVSEYIDDNVNVLKSRGKCYLRLTNSSSRRFISIIDPIFPKCMIRKAKWKDKACDYYIRQR